MKNKKIKKSLSSWHTEARNEESKKRPISFSPPPLLLSVFPRRLPDSPRVRFRGSRRWPRCALSPTRRAPRLPTPRAAASLPHTPVPPATAHHFTSRCPAAASSKQNPRLGFPLGFVAAALRFAIFGRCASASSPPPTPLHSLLVSSGGELKFSLVNTVPVQ